MVSITTITKKKNFTHFVIRIKCKYSFWQFFRFSIFGWSIFHLQKKIGKFY